MQSYFRRTQLHSTTLRARRRRRARILLACITLLILAIISGAVYAVRSPYTRLQNIQVTGADINSNVEIMKFAHSELMGMRFYFVPRDSILFYGNNTLQADVLHAFPRLATASVRLTSLSSLSISVSERLPKALWCGASPSNPTPCLLLDGQGVAYGLAPDIASSTPYILYYGALDTSKTPPQFLDAESFNALALLVDSLAQKFGAGPVMSVTVSGEGDVTVQFHDGFKALVTLDDAEHHAGSVLNNASIVFMSSPFAAHKIADFEYLDLRFGDRLYYKLKGASAPSSASTTKSQ